MLLYFGETMRLAYPGSADLQDIKVLKLNASVPQSIKILNMIKLYGKPIRVNKSSQDKRSQEVGANLFIGNLDPDVDEKVAYLLLTQPTLQIVTAFQVFDGSQACSFCFLPQIGNGGLCRLLAVTGVGTATSIRDWKVFCMLAHYIGLYTLTILQCLYQ